MYVITDGESGRLPPYSCLMSAQRSGVAVLLDIDGVLHIGEEPIAGACAALGELREITDRIRLLTNTTSKSRRQIVAQLERLGFELSAEEVLTPAALAVKYCREQGHKRVKLMVADALLEDLEDLDPAGDGEPADAVLLGDLGDALTPSLLNDAFRPLIEGAELIALQHNRYWQSPDGLVLDVGAYSAALEYAGQCEAFVVGKPAAAFFTAALDELAASPETAVMIGDDLEADVGGALAAGLRGVLVRTGKYRDETLESSSVTPSEIIDSVADVPALIRKMI